MRECALLFFSPSYLSFLCLLAWQNKNLFFLFFFLGSKLFYPMILCFEVPSSVLLFRFGIQNKEVVCMFACSFFFCVLALKKKKVVGSRLLCLYLSILYFVFKSLSYLPLFTNRFLFLPAAANAGHLSVCGRTLKWDKRRLVSCFLPSCLPESQLPAQCDLLRNEIVLEKELVFFFLSSCFFFFFFALYFPHLGTYTSF